MTNHTLAPPGGTLRTPPQFLGPQTGVRVVAIRYRGYPGSISLPNFDLLLLRTGTDEQKTKLLRGCGVGFSSFIDQFVEQDNLPPISFHRKTGGFSTVSRSLGTTFVLAVAVNVVVLLSEAGGRFGLRLGVVILLGKTLWRIATCRF